MIARPIATRWRWPPDSSRGLRRSRSSRPRRRAVSTLAARPRAFRAAASCRGTRCCPARTCAGRGRNSGRPSPRHGRQARARSRPRPPIRISPGSDLFEPGDHPQRRRLAASRRPDEDHELAVGDLDVTPSTATVPSGKRFVTWSNSIAAIVSPTSGAQGVSRRPRCRAQGRWGRQAYRRAERKGQRAIRRRAASRRPRTRSTLVARRGGEVERRGHEHAGREAVRHDFDPAVPARGRAISTGDRETAAARDVGLEHIDPDRVRPEPRKGPDCRVGFPGGNSHGDCRRTAAGSFRSRRAQTALRTSTTPTSSTARRSCACPLDRVRLAAVDHQVAGRAQPSRGAARIERLVVAEVASERAPAELQRAVAGLDRMFARSAPHAVGGLGHHLARVDADPSVRPTAEQLAAPAARPPCPAMSHSAMSIALIDVKRERRRGRSRTSRRTVSCHEPADLRADPRPTSSSRSAAG